jgi:hypothetical protein
MGKQSILSSRTNNVDTLPERFDRENSFPVNFTPKLLDGLERNSSSTEGRSFLDELLRVGINDSLSLGTATPLKQRRSDRTASLAENLPKDRLRVSS